MLYAQNQGVENLMGSQSLLKRSRYIKGGQASGHELKANRSQMQRAKERATSMQKGKELDRQNKKQLIRQVYDKKQRPTTGVSAKSKDPRMDKKKLGSEFSSIVAKDNMDSTPFMAFYKD